MVRTPGPPATIELSAFRLTEQRHDRLGSLIGDRQRSDAQLLLALKRLESCGLRGEVGVDKVSDAGLDHVAQFAAFDQRLPLRFLQYTWTKIEADASAGHNRILVQTP